MHSCISVIVRHSKSGIGTVPRISKDVKLGELVTIEIDMRSDRGSIVSLTNLTEFVSLTSLTATLVDEK